MKVFSFLGQKKNYHFKPDFYHRSRIPLLLNCLWVG